MMSSLLPLHSCSLFYQVMMPHNGQPVQIRIGMHTGPCVSGGGKRKSMTAAGMRQPAALHASFNITRPFFICAGDGPHRIQAAQVLSLRRHDEHGFKVASLITAMPSATKSS